MLHDPIILHKLSISNSKKIIKLYGNKFSMLNFGAYPLMTFTNQCFAEFQSLDHDKPVNNLDIKGACLRKYPLSKQKPQIITGILLFSRFGVCQVSVPVRTCLLMVYLLASSPDHSHIFNDNIENTRVVWGQRPPQHWENMGVHAIIIRLNMTRHCAAQHML